LCEELIKILQVLWQLYSSRTEAKNLGEEHISLSLSFSLKEGIHKRSVDMSQIHSGEKRDQSRSGKGELRDWEAGRGL
jgi:hypothetical protein